MAGLEKTHLRQSGAPGLALLLGTLQVTAVVPRCVRVPAGPARPGPAGPGSSCCRSLPCSSCPAALARALLSPSTVTVIVVALERPFWLWAASDVCLMVFPLQCCRRPEGTRSSLAQLPASHGAKSGHFCMGFSIFLPHASSITAPK